MTTSVAVINWNSGNLLRSCVESLLAVATDSEILVIDNASTDASLEYAEGFRSRVDFIRNSVNRGFAAAVNQAFQATSTSYVLILNPDIRVLPGSVEILNRFMDAHPRAGAAAGYAGDKYLPRKFPTIGSLIMENLGVGGKASISVTRRGTADESAFVSVDQPAAAAFMIRRDTYEEVGGFDEQFFPAWYEDVDFCLRIKEQGWEIFFIPSAEFTHSGGYSAEALGDEAFLRAYYSNQLRYAQKHFGSAGRAIVRASVAVGMIGRMFGRPRQARAYGKAMIGALKGW